MMQKIILFYFLFINAVAFMVYAFDKYRSLKGNSRISERELHTFAMIGGFFGATLSMALFKHKTSKSSFLVKHILIILIWIIGTVYYFTQINTLNFLR
jgi:uncharacterized membrane protein YsdA (DUF1294 family)